MTKKENHIMNKIYFTSDTHFGHKSILHLGEGRPFESVEEMDEAMIANWNSVVDVGDRIYHLGDFSFHKPKETLEILQRLNGQIFLIEGNHDSSRMKDEVRSEFIWTKIRYNLKVSDEDTCDISGKQTIVLDHFPHEIWDKRHYGAWHLHGHCHGHLDSPAWQPRLDVGADKHNFTPISYEFVKEHMSKKTFVPLDHHSDKRKK